MEWFELGRLVLAGIAGGAVVPYLTNLRERRAARALFAEQIAVAEETRWAGDKTWFEFESALASLESRALSAGVRRPALILYVRLARLARATTQREFEIHGISEEVGLDNDLSRQIKASRDLLINLAWYPWRTRIGLKSAIVKIETDTNALQSQRTGIQWSVWNDPDY